MGDALEVQALTSVLATPDRPRGQGIAVGSVKTNVGHLEAAAGMASLIKTVLALEHRAIPANLHFNTPNPHAPFDRLPVSVPTSLTPWPHGEGRALAGVSAFGFGGTNSHVVLQEAPPRPPAEKTAAASLHLLPLSAKTAAGLKAMAQSFRDFLAQPDAPAFEDVCVSAGARRQHHDQRLAIVCSNRQQAIEQLDAYLRGETAGGLTAGEKPYGCLPKTAFVFSESLDNWGDAGRSLRAANAAFGAALEECDREMRRLANVSVLEWLDAPSARRRDAALTGPALFALQVAFAAAWKSWGVVPDVIVGIGRGETAAAHIAGSLTLEEALKTATRRSDLPRASENDRAPAIPLVLASRTGKDLSAAWKALGEREPEVIVEVGPAVVRNALVSWAKSSRPECRVVSSLQGAGSGIEQVLPALAANYAAGHALVWDQIYPRSGSPVRLPSYPWQRKRFWIDSDRYFSHSFGQTQVHGKNGALPNGAPAPVANLAPAAEVSSEWLYELNWEIKSKTWIDIRNTQTPATQSVRWLVLLDSGGVGEKVAAGLEAANASCTRVRPAELGSLEKILGGAAGADWATWTGIVDLRALDAPADGQFTAASLVDLQSSLCGVASELICRLVAAQGVGATKLFLVTRGAQPAANRSSPSAVAQAALWGLGRTLAQETPRHWGGLIDLDPTAADDESAAAVVEQIAFPDDEIQIAFRNGQRHVARLVPRPETATPAGGFVWQADGTYLLTGGLGGLGPVIADWMIDQGARRFIFLGRTELPPRISWSEVDAASELGRKIATVRKLEARGASVHLAAVDVADERQLRAYLEAFRAEGWPRLRGVVHLADDIHLNVIGGFTADQYRRVFRAKAAGAWALHRVLSEFRDEALDFFALFSSSAAVLPSPLLAGLGAACASLDALASLRRSLGLRVLSVNWSEWSERSLVARALKRQNLPAFHNIKGVTDRQGLAIFGRLLAEGASQTTVIPLSAEDWFKRPAAPFESRVREEMIRRHPSAAAVRERPELSTPYVGPRTELEKFLADTWQSSLKIDRVGIHDNFFELGGDSLQGALLLNRLQEGLKEVIHPHVLFDKRTINDFAAYLRHECASGVKRKFPSENVGGQQDWDPDWPAFLEEDDIDKMRSVYLMWAGKKLLPEPGPKNPRAIFVLSPPRSGSTLFRVMMAGHPQLFAPPELELLPYQNLAERRNSYSDDTIAWLEGADRALMELRGCTGEEAQAAMQEYERSGMSTKDFYRLLQDSVPGRVLVDKTPTNTSHLETLRHAELLFDDALYIHLVRHPCAMIVSYVEYKLYQTYVDRFRILGKFPIAPRQMGELIWLICQRNVLKFLEGVPKKRQCQVRFEDLVADPEKTLRDLCAFMELPYCPAMAQPYENKERKMTTGTHVAKRMHGDQKFLIAHQTIDPTVADRWKSDMSPDLLGNPAREIAAILGYTDVPPPVVHRKAAAPSAAIPRLQPIAPTTAEQIDDLRRRTWTPCCPACSLTLRRRNRDRSGDASHEGAGGETRDSPAKRRCSRRPVQRPT